MHITAGNIIISAASLQDPSFEKAVILITEHNEKGATGFVINKPFSRKLNELVEFINAKPFSLYAGGPVDTENLFVLHRRPGLIPGSSPLFNNIYTDGNFKQAVQHINDAVIGSNDIKLFIGYCGWDKNELENEIKEGSWIVAEGNEEIIFDDGSMLWEKLHCKK